MRSVYTIITILILIFGILVYSFYQNKYDIKLIPLFDWSNRNIDQINILDIEADGYDDLIITFNMPHSKLSNTNSPDTLSLIHFNKFDGTLSVLVREFYYPPGVFSGAHKSIDADQDGKMDIFIGFNDSTSLSLLHFPHYREDPKIYKLTDSPTFTLPAPYTWEEDAQASVIDAFDTNGDSQKDLLLVKLWSYVFKYPRAVLGYSLLHEKILWYFPLSGPFGCEPEVVVNGNDTLIVLSSIAPLNGRLVEVSSKGRFAYRVRADWLASDTLYSGSPLESDPDSTLTFLDRNTYILVIDIHGNLIWHKKLFESYSNAKHTVVKSLYDNQLIVTGNTYANRVSDIPEDTLGSYFKMLHFDLSSGKEIGSLTLPQSHIVFLESYEIENYITVCDTSTGIIQFYNSDLTVSKTVKLGKPVRTMTVFNRLIKTAPTYKIVFQDGSTRIYQTGFSKFYDITDPDELFNQYYIAETGPGALVIFSGKLQEGYNFSLYVPESESPWHFLMLSWLFFLLLIVSIWIFRPWWFYIILRTKTYDILSPESIGFLVDTNLNVRRITENMNVIIEKKTLENYLKLSEMRLLCFQVDGNDNENLIRLNVLADPMKPESNSVQINWTYTGTSNAKFLVERKLPSEDWQIVMEEDSGNLYASAEMTKIDNLSSINLKKSTDIYYRVRMKNEIEDITSNVASVTLDPECEAWNDLFDSLLGVIKYNSKYSFPLSVNFTKYPPRWSDCLISSDYNITIEKLQKRSMGYSGLKVVLNDVSVSYSERQSREALSILKTTFHTPKTTINIVKQKTEQLILATDDNLGNSPEVSEISTKLLQLVASLVVIHNTVLAKCAMFSGLFVNKLSVEKSISSRLCYNSIVNGKLIQALVMGSERNIVIEKYDIEDYEMLANIETLEMAVYNLIDNSINFTSRGESIHVSARMLTVGNKLQHLCIKVKDSPMTVLGKMTGRLS